jgi:hypothetical protein
LLNIPKAWDKWGVWEFGNVWAAGWLAWLQALFLDYYSYAFAGRGGYENDW